MCCVLCLSGGNAVGHQWLHRLNNISSLDSPLERRFGERKPHPDVMRAVWPHILPVWSTVTCHYQPGAHWAWEGSRQYVLFPLFSYFISSTPSLISFCFIFPPLPVSISFLLLCLYLSLSLFRPVVSLSLSLFSFISPLRFLPPLFNFLFYFSSLFLFFFSFLFSLLSFLFSLFSLLSSFFLFFSFLFFSFLFFSFLFFSFLFFSFLFFSFPTVYVMSLFFHAYLLIFLSLSLVCCSSSILTFCQILSNPVPVLLESPMTVSDAPLGQ